MLVSILVPVYNDEKHIERCIKSCCNQTYKNIEILIYDDGSKDNTVNIVKKIKELDSRISIFSNQKNNGLAFARRELIKKSTGEYFYFVDSDDWIESDAMQNFINCLDTKYEIVCGKSYLAKNQCNKKPYFLCSTFKKNNIKYFFDNNSPYFWNVLFNKKFVENKNLIHTIYSSPYFEDCGCLLYWFLNAKSVYLMDEFSYNYFINENSLSRKKLDYDKLKSGIDQLSNLIKLLNNKYHQDFVSRQLAFYFSILFFQISFQSSISKQQKKVLKKDLILLNKKVKLKIPKIWWKSAPFILYKLLTINI